MPRSSRPKETIVIHDDILGSPEEEREEAKFFSQFIDLTLSDEESEPEEGDWKLGVIDLDSSSPSASHPIPPHRPLRNGPTSFPFKIIEEHRSADFRLSHGRAVELKDGRFVRIEKIIQNMNTGMIFIRGHEFIRAKKLGRLLKRDLNELVLVRKVDLDDDRPATIQSVVEASLEDIKKNRKIIVTTLGFPLLTFRMYTTLNPSLPDYQLHKQKIADSDVLVCRHVYTEFHADASARLFQMKKDQKKPEERKCPAGELRKVREDEADEPNPTTVDRRAYGPHDSSAQASAGSQQSKRPKLGQKKRIITYGSGCAGAGGDAEGARMAGAKVKYGWDHNESALLTFSQNHTRAAAYQREAVHFPWEGEDASVDILHLSWPCQFFSPAHTHEGPEDDANSIAMFNTIDKLESARPLVHTQENTAGLFSHHPAFFATFIQMLIQARYNVRWKVVQFRDYGLAASRKRLILFAAPFDRPLPSFPAPTHGPTGSGLLPYTTIYDAISRIPQDATWHLRPHDNYKPPKRYEHPKARYNARECYARCLTKTGDLVHPSGLRPMTTRELACIQGFSLSYEFIGKGRAEVKGQIGNAVPPLAWKPFIASCMTTIDDWESGLINLAGERTNQRPVFMPERNGGQQTERKYARGNGEAMACAREWSAESKSLSPEIIQSIESPLSAPQIERVRRTGTASPLKRTFVDLTVDD